MRCASCDAVIDPGDRFCPACRLPNIGGIHHPRFGPPEREPGPMLVERVVGPGRRPCPRCGDGIQASDRYCRSCGIESSRLAPLPPPGRTVGVCTVPGPQGDDWYRPMPVLTEVLRLNLVAVALTSVAVVAHSLLVNHALGGSLPLIGSGGPQPDWADLQTWGGNLAALQLALLVAAAVLTLVWCRRAYRNLTALNVIDTRLSPRWAVWGWLIPGVNLVVPKRILDDTWRASDPAELPFAPGPTGWQRTSVPTSSHLWWMCTLVALPLVVLTEVQLSLSASLPPMTAAGIRDAQWGYLILAGSQALLIFAAVLFIRLVGSIRERQRDRAAAIGPVPVDEIDSTDPPAEDPEVGRQPVLVHANDSDAIGRY